MTDNRETNVVDLDYLILAPIEAVIEADFMAARRSAEFIERYGFVHKKELSDEAAGSDDDNQGAGEEPDVWENLGKLRMVRFRFDQVGPDLKPRPSIMRVPALSLIPLPLLQVNKAEFNFGIRIVQGYERKETRTLRLLKEQEQTGLPDPARYKWKAMLASEDKKQKEETKPDLSPHLSANIRAKVEVTQADIPAGIVKLLMVMGENAQIVSGWIELSNDRIKLKKGDEKKLSLALYHFNGSVAHDHNVRIEYENENKLNVKANEKDWPSGTGKKTGPDGKLDFQVMIEKDSPMKPGAETLVLFRAVVNGKPISKGLTIRVEN